MRMKRRTQIWNGSRLRMERGCFLFRLSSLAALIGLLGMQGLAIGVLVYSTGDPAHNTTAPTGALTNSGWQYQGLWGAYLGTPIAAKYFITAAHVGGSVGDMFHFSGIDYPTVAMFTDTNSDLRLWRICGTFPDHALLYPSGDEAAKPVVVLGRGTQRGAEVILSDGLTNSRKGWQWGPEDSVERWGTNLVKSIVSDASLGSFLQCNFDVDGGADEAHLSVGDSGGGVFIQDGAIWKLAGINYAVDGPFNTSTNGPGFNAAIFDESGLYGGGPGNWVLLTNGASAFYATRISSRLAWINGVVQADPMPRLLSATSLAGPYTDMPDAVVNPNLRTVLVPIPPSNHFYRLLDCDPIHIASISTNQTRLVISYE